MSTVSDGYDLLTVGETMGLMVSGRIGPLDHGGPFQLRIGGAESNVAIAGARLGLSTTWHSRLGSDEVGDLIERTLRGEGVHVVATRDPERPTGLMVKLHRSPGSTSVRYYRANSAASHISPVDVDDAAIGSARCVHLTGITAALSDTAAETVADVARRAAAAGRIVSYDINYRSRLGPGEAAGVVARRLLADVDILFGDLGELRLVDPAIETPDDARQLLSTYGLREVVVKAGADGGSVVHADGELHLPAHRVEVVDTVGAGDAFVGGYLTGLLTELPVDERLTLANRCGAHQCEVVGDWEGTPTAAELNVTAETEVNR